MTLENLVQIRQLKVEAADKREFEGLLQSATDRLTDAQNDTLSYASRFDLAYSAAHGMALAEYEGFFEADEQLLTELIATTGKLFKIVEVMDVSGSLEPE